MAWLPIGGLTRLAVRGLARLAVPGRRPVGGLTRLTVLRLTELARIWLPICHGASLMGVHRGCRRAGWWPNRVRVSTPSAWRLCEA